MKKKFTSISQCKDIVINNDIDGLLSGAFLKSVYGCNIVGMTNSKDKVLWKRGYEPSGNEVFIDFTAYGQNCIDQHIHPMHINGIINPNFDRGIYVFENYTNKFPYSTYIYILYLAAMDNKDVSKYLLPKGKFLSELIHRGDGVLKNAKLYLHNMTAWGNWMIDKLNGNQNQEVFRKFVSSLVEYHANGGNVDRYYQAIESRLERDYGFKKEELPFNEPKGNGFFSLLKLGITWEDFVPDERKFVHTRTTIRTMDEFKELVQNTNLFSYAFIYSPYNKKGYKNFSYTELLLF